VLGQSDVAFDWLGQRFKLIVQKERRVLGLIVCDCRQLIPDVLPHVILNVVPHHDSLGLIQFLVEGQVLDQVGEHLLETRN